MQTGCCPSSRPTPGVALALEQGSPDLTHGACGIRSWTPGGPSLMALALLPCAPAAGPAISSSDPSSRGPVSTSLCAKARPQMVPQARLPSASGNPTSHFITPLQLPSEQPHPGDSLPPPRGFPEPRDVSVSRDKAAPPPRVSAWDECTPCLQEQNLHRAWGPPRDCGVSFTAKGGPRRVQAAPPAPPRCWESGWVLNPQGWPHLAPPGQGC